MRGDGQLEFYCDEGCVAGVHQSTKPTTSKLSCACLVNMHLINKSQCRFTEDRYKKSLQSGRSPKHNHPLIRRESHYASGIESHERSVATLRRARRFIGHAARWSVSLDLMRSARCGFPFLNSDLALTLVAGASSRPCM